MSDLRTNHQVTQVSQREVQGSADKKKLSPPVVANDPNLQRIVEKIYNDINEINQSVNQSMAANVDHTGKVGDIRIVPDPADPKNQILQGKGAYGWAQFGESRKTIYKGKIPAENKHSKPDYDSGWIAIEKGNNTTTYDIIHSLGSQILSSSVLFKFTGTASDTDYSGTGATNCNVNHVFLLSENTSQDSTKFVQLCAVDKNKVTVSTGNDGLFYIDNFINSNSITVLKGSIRVFLYKIPLGK